MSDPTTPFNAYAAPVQVDYPKPSSGYPGMLKAIAILAMVLGGLGLASALMQGVGVLFAAQFQQAFASPPVPGGTTDASERLQQELQEEIQAIQRGFLPFQAVFALAHFVVAGLLLAGGILTMGVREIGRKLLLIACGAAVLFELGRAVVNTTLQLRTASVMSDYMERMMATASDGGPQMPVGTIMGLAMVIGVVFGLAFVLVKVGFYVYAVVYLRRVDVEAHFADKAVPVTAIEVL